MKIIGLSGHARVGKDTFYRCMDRYFTERGLKTRRLALADTVKLDLDEFCLSNYGISSFTNVKEDKDIIRPLLIAHGCAKRLQTKGRHWIDIVDKRLKVYSTFVDIAVITDIRFCEYENDELTWIKQNGKLIYIDRYISPGSPFLVNPDNKDEERFCPIIKQQADQHVIWGGSKEPQDFVNEFLDTNTELWK